MTFRIGVRAAALAAAMACFAAPAMGQDANGSQLTDAQLDEAYCVRDELVRMGEPAIEVAQVYFDAKPPVDKFKRAETTVEAAERTCGQKYGWSSDQVALARTTGLHFLGLDYLMEVMSEAGVKDDEIATVRQVLKKLPTVDLDRLSNGEGADGPFSEHLNSVLIAAKFPGADKTILQYGRVLMGVTVKTIQARQAWAAKYAKK